MTMDQLRRVDTINLFSISCSIVKPIDYARFAILNEIERENCLREAESLILKVKAEKEKASLN